MARARMRLPRAAAKNGLATCALPGKPMLQEIARSQGQSAFGLRFDSVRNLTRKSPWSHPRRGSNPKYPLHSPDPQHPSSGVHLPSYLRTLSAQLHSCLPTPPAPSSIAPEGTLLSPQLLVAALAIKAHSIVHLLAELNRLVGRLLAFSTFAWRHAVDAHRDLREQVCST